MTYRARVALPANAQSIAENIKKNSWKRLWNNLIKRFKRPKPVYQLSSGQSVPLFDPSKTSVATLKAGFFKFLKKIGKLKARSYRGSKKRKSVITERAGRNIKVVRYRPGENDIAPLPTVINAARSGGYDLRSRRLTVADGDLAGWQKLERQSLTLVLLADVSHSTFPFVNVMAGIIDSLTGYFRLHRDRIGLIALSGNQARILNHPTQNYRVVTKGLLALKVQGQTPLADGLQKALAMIRLEKQRKPGSASLVILLSDCYPEPLTHQYPEIFDEPAYRESLRAAQLYRMNRVPLLLINPAFQHHEEKDFLPGERLSAMIAREANARLIKLYRTSAFGETTPQQFTPPSAREIGQIIAGIEDTLGNKPLGEGKRLAV